MSIISIAVIAWVIMSSLLKDYKSSALKFHGFEEVAAAVKKGKASQKVYKTSTSIRILVWSFSLNLIKSNPIIGVGTGDIKDELIKLYKKEGYPILVKRQYNSHNQYLQTAAALGIPTLIVLLLMFISPLLVRWRRFTFFSSISFYHCWCGLFNRVGARSAGRRYFLHFLCITVCTKYAE